MKKKVNIPIFIPHVGCPNACVFCNQRKISGRTGFDFASVRKELDEAFSTVPEDVSAQIAYFGGSFTGSDRDDMIALLALAEMLRQTGKPVFAANGILQGGVIVRHLVLPNGRHDSVALLQTLEKQFGNRAFLLSLMSQYTPEFANGCPVPELHRRVTTFEYEAVMKEAERLGFEGYFQSRASATAQFTPTFEGEPL